MARGHCRPEESVARLREAETLLAQGMKAPDMAGEQSIRELTYHGWRNEYGDEG